MPAARGSPSWVQFTRAQQQVQWDAWVRGSGPNGPDTPLPEAVDSHLSCRLKIGSIEAYCESLYYESPVNPSERSELPRPKGGASNALNSLSCFDSGRL